MRAYHETKIHGSRNFPYAIYRSVLPDFFNSFPLHWHDELEIIYVTMGEISVSVEQNEFVVSKGEMALIHPQTIHSIKQNTEKRAVYYNILFRLSLLESSGEDICAEKYLKPIFYRKLVMPNFIGRDNLLLTKLTPLVDSLIENAPQLSSDNELLIKSRVFEFMHYVKNVCDVSDETGGENERFYEKLKVSLSYLEDNYAENITVADAASMCNFSPSYFSKMFRELTGSSFTKYLKNYRLERAAEKISNEKMKISDAASSCGFDNLSYFTRAFKEKYKVTPTQFKNESNDNRHL